jgi:hypothetical protein
VSDEELEEFVYDDDDDEPLPVISADGPVLSPGRPKRQRVRIAPRRRHEGNTKVAEAPQKRAAVLAEAKGQGLRAPDEWREELAAGSRDKAVAAIPQGLTHGASSGFGIAGNQWWEQ